METSEPIKSRFQYYHLANDVLLGNFIANMIGSFMTDFFISNRTQNESESVLYFFWGIDALYNSFCVILGAFIVIYYERPIRKCLKKMYNRQELDPQKACETLIQRANLAGGRDNITVILVRRED